MFSTDQEGVLMDCAGRTNSADQVTQHTGATGHLLTSPTATHLSSEH